MQSAGQFLVPLSAFFDWFNTPGIVAVGVMLFMLFKLRANYLLRLSTDITPEKFNIGLGVGSALSIVSTLLLTTTSLMFLENVVEMTGVGLNPDRAHAAGIDQTRYPATQPSSVGVMAAKGFGTAAAKNKYGQAVIVVSVLLLVIGAGYAFTMLNLSFWESFLAMSMGVGLPEELSKAAAGLLVLYMIFDTKSLSEFQFRRAVLAAFGIAGLGFGAGEALKYFGEYAHEGANAFAYGLRAVYCVTLHGAWTLIVGGMLATSLPQDPKLLENKKIDTFYMLLLASIPTAIAHGLYNTLCFQDNILLALSWGGLSIFVAFRVIEAFLKENQEESKPPPLPS